MRGVLSVRSVTAAVGHTTDRGEAQNQLPDRAQGMLAVLHGLQEVL